MFGRSAAGQRQVSGRCFFFFILGVEVRFFIDASGRGGQIQGQRHDHRCASQLRSFGFVSRHAKSGRRFFCVVNHPRQQWAQKNNNTDRCAANRCRAKGQTWRMLSCRGITDIGRLNSQRGRKEGKPLRAFKEGDSLCRHRSEPWLGSGEREILINPGMRVPRPELCLSFGSWVMRIGP